MPNHQRRYCVCGRRFAAPFPEQESGLCAICDPPALSGGTVLKPKPVERAVPAKKKAASKAVKKKATKKKVVKKVAKKKPDVPHQKIKTGPKKKKRLTRK
jgi:hypothetical protein